MSELTVEEVLIVRVATATCFAFPFKSAEIPPEDIEIYVGELRKLYSSKPDAPLTIPFGGGSSRSHLLVSASGDSGIAAIAVQSGGNR